MGVVQRVALDSGMEASSRAEFMLVRLIFTCIFCFFPLIVLCFAFCNVF